MSETPEHLVKRYDQELKRLRSLMTQMGGTRLRLELDRVLWRGDHGGLKQLWEDLPRDLYDAADVDGASAWQKLRLITLPQMKPVISMVVTLQLISTLRIFSQVYVMTDGGPASSSSSVIYYVYTMAIRRGLFGYAAAVSMMLFAVILLVTLVQRQLIRER